MGCGAGLTFVMKTKLFCAITVFAALFSGVVLADAPAVSVHTLCEETTEGAVVARNGEGRVVYLKREPLFQWTAFDKVETGVKERLVFNPVTKAQISTKTRWVRLILKYEDERALYAVSQLVGRIEVGFFIGKSFVGTLLYYGGAESGEIVIESNAITEEQLKLLMDRVR